MARAETPERHQELERDYAAALQAFDQATAEHEANDALLVAAPSRAADARRRSQRWRGSESSMTIDVAFIAKCTGLGTHEVKAILRAHEQIGASGSDADDCRPTAKRTGLDEGTVRRVLDHLKPETK